jgi:hypothetical protein
VKPAWAGRGLGAAPGDQDVRCPVHPPRSRVEPLGDLPARVGNSVSEEPLEVTRRQAAFLSASGAAAFGLPVQVIACQSAFQQFLSPGLGGRINLGATEALGGLLLGEFLGDDRFQDLPQVRADGLPEDVEDLVAEGHAHVLHLLQQDAEDVALAGVGGDQIEDVHVIGLADPVDAAHTLLQPVGFHGMS